MKTSRTTLSPRQVRLARFFLVGFALSLAPLGAQTASQPATSASTAPGTSASTITSPPHANTSFYNSPSTGTSTGAAPVITPQAGSAKSGTVAPNVNAGGGSGSGQTGGATSPSSP